MYDTEADDAIADLAERIVDRVSAREPDWPALARWARDFARLCEARTEPR